MRWGIAAAVLGLAIAVWLWQRGPEPATPSESAPVAVKEIQTAEGWQRFEQRDYTPPRQLRSVARSQASPSSPEAAADALYSAATSQDFDWWQSLWDAHSREINARSDQALGLDRARWAEAWSELARGRLELVRRIDYGEHAILYARHVRPGQAPEEGSEQPIVVREEAEGFVLTQALRAHPVLVYADGSHPEAHPVREVTQ